MDSIAEATRILTRILEALARQNGKTLSQKTRANLARELAALTGAPLKTPAIAPVKAAFAAVLPVKVEAPELCGRAEEDQEDGQHDCQLHQLHAALVAREA